MSEMEKEMSDVEDGIPLRPEHKPTITVTRRTDRSLYMFMIQHLMKPFKGHIIKPRKQHPPGSQKLEPCKKAREWCDIQEREVDGFYIYDLMPKQASQHRGRKEQQRRFKRIYYFAGGGWQMPPSSEHWVLCAELAKQLPDTTISMISYPLAPNTPAPVSFPGILKLYHTLLQRASDDNEKVILAGDSAGGNIVLCLTLTALLEDPDCRVPSALFVISPSTDLRRQNPDIQVVAKKDPILTIPFINATAQKWRADWDPCDPRISPLYADVSPLAKRGVDVHGVFGRYDILSPDALLFREKCNQAFVKGEWLDWEKQMHCFPLMWSFGLSEGKAAVRWMVDVLKRC